MHTQKRSSRVQLSREWRQWQQEQHGQEEGCATERYDEDEDEYDNGDDNIDHEPSDFSASPRKELRKVSEAVQR